MFELLLQADRALADGALDQAEKTYWQLVDLDPTNAIALTGLARVAIERGDETAARQYADKALSIDPDSTAARKILEILTHEGPEDEDQESNDLPLLGAERLEALSRRRGIVVSVAEEGATPDAVTLPRAGREVASAQAAPAPAAATRGGKATRTPATPATPTNPQSRGRTRPDQMLPMTSEPLRERRKAGRLAAAAAAAAAEAREPVRARYQPHRAMPIGRRFFEPGELKTQPADAFARAEMAAAVEAVDALDEAGYAAVDAATLAAADAAALAAADAAALAAAEERGGSSLNDVMGDVDATAADESVAMRIALVSDAVELEAAEREAALFNGGASDDEWDAVEAEAAAALPADPDSVASAESSFYGTDDGADEFEAAEAVAQSQAGWEQGPRQSPSVAGEFSTSGFAAVEAEAALARGSLPGTSPEFADADAAEAAAAAEAAHEVAGASGDAREVEPAPVRPTFRQPGPDEPSEEEAEAQALREAVAAVLEGNERIAGDEGAKPAAPAASAASAEPESRPDATEPPFSPPSASTEDTSQTPPRKGGLFRRIRGG